MKEPKNISDILDSMINSTQLGEHLEHARIWKHWPELAGYDLGLHGRPKDIRDGQLRVEVDSAVWMHRYALKKFEIIKRINRFAGKELISDIFVILYDDSGKDA